MLNEKKIENGGKVPFEDALNMAGFGVYSYMMTMLSGLTVISFACVVFSTTFIIPTSACELATTSAQQGITASGPIMGVIIGGVICGYLGDKYGRRRMLIYALISAATLNSLASISVNWVMLVILQSLACFCAAGEYSLAMTLISESVPMLKRNMVVLLVTSLFLSGLGIMAVIAMPVIPLTFSIYVSGLGIYWNSWRTLLLVFSVPSLLAAFGLTFAMESPKYIYIQGNQQGAVDIIKKIHRLNNRHATEDLNITGLILDNQGVRPPSASQNRITPLFRMPLLKYTFIVTSLFMCQQNAAFSVWLPSIANQFVRVVQTGQGINEGICGILHDSRDIPVDPDVAPCSLNKMSLVFILSIGLIQALSNVLLILAVNRMGRRNMAMIVTLVCGLSGIITNLIPNAYASAAFFIVFMIGILTMGLYTAIAVALFPTHYRALAVALTMTGGRLVTFASVQILKLLLEVNCDAGFYVFNSIFAGSAIILAFLPDDRFINKKQQKIEEEESIKMIDRKLSL